MDEKTIRYYEENARRLLPAYEGITSSLRARFPSVFPRGGRILDVGAGTGRDAAGLVADGYEAWGVEPSAAFRECAVERHPELRERILKGVLPDGLPEPEELGGRFDGILCSAVLQHVPRHRVLEAILQFKKVLRQGGRVLLSVPLDRPGIDGNDRDAVGRLFTPLHPGEVQLLFERAGFQLIDSWVDADPHKRPGHRWTAMVLRLEAGEGARALDRIEGVLSADKKVATYKFALIRALAEIAVRKPHLAAEGDGNHVTVPLRSVAELWIRYYWPLLAASRRRDFLPQREGDRRTGRHGLAFASPLLELIDLYPQGTGLQSYLLDLRQGRLPPSVGEVRNRVLVAAERAIREGPVRHAGAVTESGPLFSCRAKQVYIARPLWRELSLLGCWIGDAVILRWAEETVRISGFSVKASTVVDALLADGDPEREQGDARDLFGSCSSLTCVWTGRPLTRATMAIDHVIPFSLMGNNDLWNLLPAEKGVNSKKRDLLPARKALEESKGIIKKYWSFAMERRTERFSLEVREWTGRSGVTTEDLFELVCECIEFLALQRGTPRWPDGKRGVVVTGGRS